MGIVVAIQFVYLSEFTAHEVACETGCEAEVIKIRTILQDDLIRSPCYDRVRVSRDDLEIN